MGISTGRLRDPVAGRPGDQMKGRSGDVRGNSIWIWIQLRNMVTQGLQSIVVAKNSVKSIVIKNII